MTFLSELSLQINPGFKNNTDSLMEIFSQSGFEFMQYLKN